jgi:hypothetical protein
MVLDWNENAMRFYRSLGAATVEGGSSAGDRRRAPALAERRHEHSRLPRLHAGVDALPASLKRNNTREWFQAHRDDYERDVRAPLAALVEEMDVRLAELAPEIVGDPKRSLFRIHRDVRFSNDKSPYKTNAAAGSITATPAAASARRPRHGGAGFYFPMEPGRSMIGAWHLDAAAVPRWRGSGSGSPRTIVGSPARWAIRR